MNICVLYYDGFAEFEIVLTLLGSKVHKMHKVQTIALEDRVYESEEKQLLLPHTTVANIDPDTVDMLIIPGGDPAHLYESEELKSFVNRINDNKKWIGGICGGTELMASYGVLDNRKCTGDSSGIVIDADYAYVYKNANIIDKPIVVDGNTITAMGQAYVEFAIEMKKKMGIYQSDEEALEAMKWLKNGKI